MPFLYSFVSVFQNVIYFGIRQLDMPKIVFQKVAWSPLHVFFLHYTAQNKDIGLRLFTPVVGAWFSTIYSSFWIS